ncbi:hypothetical protein ACH42_09825 [Endozoicomonas sp. (ex Bugula neritina AB1)]|nr:hypothetical protein ACH42_09825 [Endozoicomonas sp. (ex Bugula neritina AB1)]
MPELDYGAARFWWDVIQTLAVFALFVWTLIDRKRQHNSEGIDELKASQKKLDRRVQRLEDTQAQLPTHHDLTAIKVQVVSLATKIEGMDNKLETIHQFLLNHKKGA